jgi:hypothetical protein
LPVLEQPLDDLERVLLAPQLEQDLGGGAEALDRVVDVLDPQERLAEPEVRERVLRIEVDDLAEDVDRVALPSGALEPGRYFEIRPSSA